MKVCSGNLDKAECSGSQKWGLNISVGSRRIQIKVSRFLGNGIMEIIISYCKIDQEWSPGHSEAVELF